MQSTYIYTLKSLFQNFNGHGINWTLLLNLMRSKPNDNNENSSLEPTMRPVWPFSKWHQKELATLQSVKKTTRLCSNKALPFGTTQGLCTWMTAFDCSRVIESDKACAILSCHAWHTIKKPKFPMLILTSQRSHCQLSAAVCGADYWV